MALNPKQRAAVFEKLKSSGKLTTNAPKVPMAHPKMLQPPMPPPPVQGAPPVANPAKPNMINQNLIGPAKAEHFKKIKAMFGL